jgi:threonylcarbamoyladenosine tRNA methylthiotransferase MtaB
MSAPAGLADAPSGTDGAALRTLTLGCRVNQYETEFVRQAILRAGYRDARSGEPAELCLVNTCSVTHEADAKSRQAIRQLARHNPQARIVVMGCYATRAPAELAGLPNVAEVVTDKRELGDLVLRLGADAVPPGIANFPGRRRAYVKVQDGCLLRCSYCIIPHVRPYMVSRPPGAVLDEISRLVDAGHREIVLTGIHLGHYGVDFNRGRPRGQWVRLAHLLERIVRLPGQFRVRLSSIEATEVTRHLLDVMASNPVRICPHLHVAMQSGSDAILRRMRRRWGADRLVDRCRLATVLMDRPALTTDCIVGFPGETDADFDATCRVVEEIGFSKLHIFPFSPRPGTPAASMTGQVEARVKADRAARLAELGAELRRRYWLQLLGRRLHVLVEGRSAARPRNVVGTSCRYADVEFESPSDRRGDLVQVTAAALGDDTILATI